MRRVELHVESPGAPLPGGRARGPASCRATTSSGWPGPARRRSTWSWTRSALRRESSGSTASPARRSSGAVRLPRVRLVAVPHGRPRGRQAALDREGRDRVRRLGDALLRRRRPRCSARCSTGRAALPPRGRAAGRPAVRRRRARHLRVPRRPLEPVGAPVALPRRDRRRAGQGRRRAGGLRLPLSRGRVRLRALPRPPHGLPARLPRRLRLLRPCARGPGRARPPGARRARAGARGEALEGAAGPCGRRSSRSPCRSRGGPRTAGTQSPRLRAGPTGSSLEPYVEPAERELELAADRVSSVGSATATETVPSGCSRSGMARSCSASRAGE